MRTLFFLVLCLLLPAVLAAQPLRVQTGEHNLFTRVVVRLPNGVDWQFGRGPDGYVLRMSVTDGYDLRSFFNLIPRQRISAVSQNAETGELRLDLDCVCRADVFTLEKGYLVIDIANGRADPAAPFEHWLDGFARPQIAASVPPPHGGAGILPIILPRDAARPAVLPSVVFSDTTQRLMPSLDEDIASFERLVVDGLGRGLSAGVLQSDMSGEPAASLRQGQVTPGQSLPGIAVSTGVDPEAITSVQQSAIAADGSSCVSDDLLNVADWADEQPFASQLGELRSSMVHEFDRFDPQAIEKLARLYLHFGFGREALQILKLDGATSQKRRYLQILAQIIDETTVRFPDVERQLTCPSRIALWAFLAAPDAEVDMSSQTVTILRAFKELPAPLQRYLGPRLAEHFTAIGASDAAFQALSSAKSLNPDALETQLASAALAGQLGDNDTALRTLSELADASPRVTPEAMIRFFTESMRQNQPVATDKMIVADALRFEHALSPAAGDLAEAQIKAYLAANAFSEAASLIEEAQGDFDPTRRARLERDFGLAAVARMPDGEFLDYAFGKALPMNSPELQTAVGSRLIALGFPDASTRFLQDGSSPGADDPQPTADDSRAGSMTVTADLSELETLQNSWRDGDWARLAQADDPLLQGAAATIMGRTDQIFDSQMPLASGRALLEDTVQSRRLLDALLERFEVPDDF